MTLQFAFSTLMPLFTFAVLAGIAGRLVQRQLLPGRTRIALPLFCFAALCELTVFLGGWIYLFDEAGRFRIPEGWVLYIFSVVEPLARLSALTGAIVAFFGVKGSASQ